MDKQTDEQTQTPETKAPEEMSLEELERAIDAEIKTQKDTPAPAPAPLEKELEIKLETGQVYRGKSMDEIAQKLAKAEEEATKALRDREEQIRNLTSALATKPRVEPRQAEKQPESTFDSKKYYELLQTEPLAAQDYVLMHNPTVQKLVMKLQRIDEGIETYNFQLRNKDYPSTKEASAAVMARMEAEGREWTADNLEVVYNSLKLEGVVKPVVQEEQKKEEITMPKPPPEVRSSSSAPDIMEKVESLTDEQLEALLRKKGLLI